VDIKKTRNSTILVSKIETGKGGELCIVKHRQGSQMFNCSYQNAGVHTSQAPGKGQITQFCMVAPDIFSIIIVVLSLIYKNAFSSHA